MTRCSLTYSFPNLQPVCWSMSSSNCCFLTCIQISQEAGHVVWCCHLLKDFQLFVVIHTVKGFGIVNKAEIDVFLELSCNLRYTDDTTLMVASEEELKSLLMKVKEESEKVGLNKAQHSENQDHGTWSHHFMANRWGNNERVYFGGLQNQCRW